MQGTVANLAVELERLMVPIVGERGKEYEYFPLREWLRRRYQEVSPAPPSMSNQFLTNSSSVRDTERISLFCVSFLIESDLTYHAGLIVPWHIAGELKELRFLKGPDELLRFARFE